LINEIKEHMHKHLKEFQEETNKQLNKIRKTRKDIREAFNKDIEICKISN
jgi:DNA anti-recombination protein RmuC